MLRNIVVQFRSSYDTITSPIPPGYSDRGLIDNPIVKGKNNERLAALKVRVHKNLELKIIETPKPNPTTPSILVETPKPNATTPNIEIPTTVFKSIAKVRSYIPPLFKNPPQHPLSLTTPTHYPKISTSPHRHGNTGRNGLRSETKERK